MNTNIATKFIKRPRNIIWIVVAVLLLSLTVLASFVYAKDTPKFIPEKTREEIREGVIEAVAEPIGRVLPSMKQVIVRAAWTKEKKENNGNSYGHEEDGNGKNDTQDWPTYTDEEIGVSFKYPEGWVATEGDEGVVSFSPDEDSYDLISIEMIDGSINNINSWWDSYTLEWGTESSHMGSFKVGGVTINHFQDNSPVPNYYVYEKENMIFILSAVGQGSNYYEEIISSFIY